MLKVGVLGAGHLGSIHIQQWLEIDKVELVGFYDPNDENAAKVAQTYQVKRYDDIDTLIAAVDAVDIVTPTIYHFELAKKCLIKAKHLFIEKPMTHTLQEANALVTLVAEANVKCQIGHVERFNPAFTALDIPKLHPLFIESHRLSPFNIRGTDVAVILDLMIHDIDLVLSMVKSPVRRISASGVAVVSKTADIANARIEFDNGCVANLTASRISLHKMRKTRIFQKDTYICVDFLNKKSEVFSLSDDTMANALMQIPIETAEGERKHIHVEYPVVKDQNAIKMELEAFADAIIQNKPTIVDVYDGFKSIEIAQTILEKIQFQAQMAH